VVRFGELSASGQALLAIMRQVGTNGALASKRRQQWSREEHRAKQDRYAVWLEKVEGTSIVNRVRFGRVFGSTFVHFAICSIFF
jgi:hypothetical protein